MRGAFHTNEEEASIELGPACMLVQGEEWFAEWHITY